MSSTGASLSHRSTGGGGVRKMLKSATKKAQKVRTSVKKLQRKAKVIFRGYEVHFDIKQKVCKWKDTKLAGMFFCPTDTPIMSTKSVYRYLKMKREDILREMKRTQKKPKSSKDKDNKINEKKKNKTRHLLFLLKDNKKLVYKFRFAVQYIDDDIEMYYAYAHMHRFEFRLYVHNNETFFGVTIQDARPDTRKFANNVSAFQPTLVTQRSQCPLQRVLHFESKSTMCMVYYNIDALNEFVDSNYQRGYSVTKPMYLSRGDAEGDMTKSSNGSGTASETASGSASGTASGSASGTASGSASGTASGSASGSASGTAGVDAAKEQETETSIQGVLDVNMLETIVPDSPSCDDVDEEVHSMKGEIEGVLGVSFPDDALTVTKVRHRGKGALYVVHNTRYVAFLIYVFKTVKKRATS